MEYMNIYIYINTYDYHYDMYLLIQVKLRNTYLDHTQVYS